MAGGGATSQWFAQGGRDPVAIPGTSSDGGTKGGDRRLGLDLSFPAARGASSSGTAGRSWWKTKQECIEQIRAFEPVWLSGLHEDLGRAKVSEISETSNEP